MVAKLAFQLRTAHSRPLGWLRGIFKLLRQFLARLVKRDLLRDGSTWGAGVAGSNAIVIRLEGMMEVADSALQLDLAYQEALSDRKRK
jgi:hypothetical protein